MCGSHFMYSTSMLLLWYQTIVCLPHTHTHTLLACKQTTHCAFTARRHHTAHKSHGRDVMLHTTHCLVVVRRENTNTHTQSYCYCNVCKAPERAGLHMGNRTCLQQLWKHKHSAIDLNHSAASANNLWSAKNVFDKHDKNASYLIMRSY